MNFRILAAPVWPRGRVFALLAATALAASFLDGRRPRLRRRLPRCAKGQAEGRAEGCPAAPAPAAQAGAARGRQPPPAAGAPAAGAQPPDQDQVPS